MQYYIKILCIATAAIVIVAFGAVVALAAASALENAVNGHWLRAAVHALCAAVSWMLAFLVARFIDDLIR